MTHDYVALIQHYGYLATFAGTLFEGETLLILSGVAAHRGFGLSLPVVVAHRRRGGALLGDMAFFLIGPALRRNLLARFPALRAGGRAHACADRAASDDDAGRALHVPACGRPPPSSAGGCLSCCARQ